MATDWLSCPRSQNSLEISSPSPELHEKEHGSQNGAGKRKMGTMKGRLENGTVQKCTRKKLQISSISVFSRLLCVVPSGSMKGKGFPYLVVSDFRVRCSSPSLG